MLAGRRPFGRNTAVEVEAHGLKPPRLPMLNSHQWQALKTGLAVHRAHRFETVFELCEGLLSSSGERYDRPRLVVAA